MIGNVSRIYELWHYKERLVNATLSLSFFLQSTETLCNV